MSVSGGVARDRRYGCVFASDKIELEPPVMRWWCLKSYITPVGYEVVQRGTRKTLEGQAGGVESVMLDFSQLIVNKVTYTQEPWKPPR